MIRIASVLFWLALTGTVNAAPAMDSEEAVYQSYLATFKAIKSPDEHAIDKYLSKVARQKLAEAMANPGKRNCNPCPNPAEALQMEKEMRPYPKADVRPMRTQAGGVVTLVYTWHEAAGSGSGIGTRGTDMVIQVQLVQEQGWKLKSESWTMTENPGTSTMSAETKWSY